MPPEVYIAVGSVLAALVGFVGIWYQVRSLRRENTDQHDENAQKLTELVGSFGDHREAVHGRFDRVDATLEDHHGRLQRLEPKVEQTVREVHLTVVPEDDINRQE